MPDLPPFFVLTGAHASGKSWVSLQLAAAGWNYVAFDLVRKRDRLAVLEAALRGSRPVVYDMAYEAKRFCREHPEWKPRMVVIIESVEVLRERIVGRGGLVSPTLEARAKRMVRISPLAEFSGTSTQVLAWLRSTTNT